MVGLGETFEEVINTMKEAYYAGVSIFTIGQYLTTYIKSFESSALCFNKEFENYKNLD